MSLLSLVRSVQRNKRLKTTIGGCLLIFIIYSLYYSIYGVSIKNSQREKKILNSKSSTSSTALSSYEIFHQDTSNIKQLPVNSSVREQLHFQYPYNAKEPFPKLIWQTWKVSRDDPTFKATFYKFSENWITKNPEYSYNMISDSQASELINHLYQSIPKVLKAYQILPKSILKADFFRYLILFARGGVYSDIDTSALKPIDTWVSMNKTIYDTTNNAGLVIGIEADPDREDWNTYYAKRVQFCQWTLQSKVGHPMLGELIARITEITLQKEKNNELNKIVGKDAGGDIMNWTGPGIYTDEIFNYLNQVLKHVDAKTLKIISRTKKNKYNKDVNIHNDGIDWRFFTLMDEPVVIDDVLVLPITSFSPGVGHMGSKDIKHPMAYVRHMFEGSWKPEEERHIEPKRDKKTKKE